MEDRFTKDVAVLKMVAGVMEKFSTAAKGDGVVNVAGIGNELKEIYKSIADGAVELEGRL